MKTTEGKDMSEFIAAKKLFLHHASSAKDAKVEEIIYALKLKGVNDKQMEKIKGYVEKVYDRVKKNLGV